MGVSPTSLSAETYGPDAHPTFSIARRRDMGTLARHRGTHLGGLRAGEGGFASRLVGNRQRRKPIGQRVVEMTFDPDLISSWQRFHANSIGVNWVECRLSKVRLGG